MEKLGERTEDNSVYPFIAVFYIHLCGRTKHPQLVCQVLIPGQLDIVAYWLLILESKAHINKDHRIGERNGIKKWRLVSRTVTADYISPNLHLNEFLTPNASGKQHQQVYQLSSSPPYFGKFQTECLCRMYVLNFETRCIQNHVRSICLRGYA